MTTLKPIILIVDDDPDILDSHKLLLETKGFIVYTASKATEAIAIALRTSLDIAIIDVNLIQYPYKNREGFDLALQMDSLIPKIIYTGHQEYATAPEATRLVHREKANIVSVVIKSPNLDPLLGEIHAALSSVNLSLVIHWGHYSSRMLIDMLKGYKKRSENEKKAAEGELHALLCRMFSDADSVTIIDLKAGKGGCAVAKVDPRGQGLRGSSVVVKFGPREKVEREWENYERYVRRFVSPGAAVREDKLGRTLNLGAIKYSFIGGEDFGVYYREHSLEEIVETLDDLFRENCGRWYIHENQKAPTDEERQPLDVLYRRKDHLSLTDAEHIQELRSVFDQLLLRANSSLARHFQVEGGKHLQITFGDSSHEFPNPVEFGLRRDSDQETSVFPSASLLAITHGDLNSANILVSKEGKPCLIDFYKTGYGHIFRDIAELESVIKFELLEADSLLTRYQLERALCTPRVLTDTVALGDEFATPELTKAVGAINTLRQLAVEITSAVSLNEMREYQTALFFYALKEMVGFSSGSDNPTCCRIQQYHALLAAAMICRRLDSEAPDKEGSVFLAHEYRSPWQDRMFGRLKPFVESLNHRVIHPLDDPVVGGQLWLRVKSNIEATHCGFYEITTKNGNVYFELGYALGLRKPYFALLDKTQPNLPDIASLLRGDLILSYETEDHLQQEVKRILEFRKKWKDWFFFDKAGFAYRVMRKHPHADSVLLLVAKIERQQEVVAPPLLAALEERDQWQIGVVVLEREVDIEDFYLRALSAELVVGCFSSDKSEAAKYANAEVALALGIAHGIKDSLDNEKTVIILQEEGSEVLTDLKSLTKSFQGAEGAVEALNEELEKWFRGRLKGDAS